MTGTDCIPITLPAAQWREVWRVLNDQTSEGKLAGEWRRYTIHEQALQEIQFRGAEKRDQFTCFLCAADVWLWTRSVAEDVAACVRRQVMAFYEDIE